MVGVGAPIFLNPGVGVGFPQKLGLRIPAAKALAAIDDLIRFQRSRWPIHPRRRWLVEVQLLVGSFAGVYGETINDDGH